MKKTVLITGGSKGIGQATAKVLLENGYRVILAARHAEGLETARANFVQAGFADHDIETFVLDMVDVDAIETVVPQLHSLQDGLFGLVNNAAFEVLKKVTDYSKDDLENTWRVNMLAPILMIRACYPFLRQVNGSVVNVGSISDHEHNPRYSVYGGSKSFLNAFSLHAAKELGFDGIRINVVSPGATDTPLMQKIIDDGIFTPQLIEDVKRKIPMEQRFSTAHEVALAIYFALTGPRHLHGMDLRIHGGSE